MAAPPPPPPPNMSGLTPTGYPQEKNPNDPGYNPSMYSHTQPVQGKHPQGPSQEGYLALVDEDTGEEVGVLEQVHISGVQSGSHDPVQVELPPVGSDGIVTVRPAPAEYLRDASHPAYANSTLVSTAAAASRFIVTASTYVAKAMESGAETFTKRTKPLAQPVTFNPVTHNRVARIHNFTSGAAKVSSHTLGKVTHHAQNLGAKIANKNVDRPEKEPPAKPGIFNKSLIAFSTVADGIDHASRLLLTSGSTSATAIVGHRYGAEAEQVARGLTGSAKNVGLVYVDASGVSRRALVKSVAKGMVVGKVRGGGEVIVQGENGSQIDLIPGPRKSGPPQQGYQSYATGPPPAYPSVGGEVNLHPNTNQNHQQYPGSGRTSPIPPSHDQYFSPLPPHRSYTTPLPPHQQQYQQNQQYGPRDDGPIYKY